MSSVVLSGDTSGTVTLTVPNIAGSNTVTVPASTGNVLMDSTTGVCRAWVNFNGTTSPGTIRASFNVSSVTKNGTGDYGINLTNSLVDANYAVSVSCALTGGTLRLCNTSGDTAPSASSRRIATMNTAFALTDMDYVTASFFR